MVGGARLGGDRRPLAGRWQSFLQEILAALQQATLNAERVGVNLTVENHQDLASEELLWLCESIGSQRFGITLDTGNPLATAEDPVNFARRVAPYVKNVHVRVPADDYWPDYPPRSAAQLAHVLRFVLDNARPAGDWRTPFERNESVEAVIAYEDQQLAASLAYILPPFAQANPS